MKIVCVSGGSYKSFYFNCFLKLKKCDLIILNYGILYKYKVKDELFGSGVVTKELFALSKALHCTVVAGIYVEKAHAQTKSIIVCDGDKIHIQKAQLGLKLHLRNITFFIGDETSKASKSHKIILTNKRIYPNINHCCPFRLYLFCDSHGVTTVENKVLMRKYNKFNFFNIKSIKE